MQELTSVRDLQTEVKIVTAGSVPTCSDAAFLLARARFLEAIRSELASAQAAS